MIRASSDHERGSIQVPRPALARLLLTRISPQERYLRVQACLFLPLHHDQYGHLTLHGPRRGYNVQAGRAIYAGMLTLVVSTLLAGDQP